MRRLASKERRAAVLVRANASVFNALCMPLLHASSSSSTAADMRARILRTWNTASSEQDATASSGASSKPTLSSKAMLFARGGAARGGWGTSSTRRNVVASVVMPTTGSDAAAGVGPADVGWVQCERMDFLVQYAIPATWCLRENARENLISIQAFPHPSIATKRDPASSDGGPSIHGITLNGFAYHKKVIDPNPDRLLDVFLKRFAPSCRNGEVQVLRRSAPMPAAAAASGAVASEGNNSVPAVSTSTGVNDPTAAKATPLDAVEGSEAEPWVQRISSRIGGAVCELTFVPAGISSQSGAATGGASDVEQPQPQVVRARGMCRACFAASRRFHYIVMAAVPEEEYAASEALIAHALMHVVESKVDAASQNF